MFVSVALAFLAASASPEAQPVRPTTAPAAKPRKICRTESVIGSLTPKRVCTVAPRREAAKPAAGAPEQKPAQSQGAASGL